MAAIHIMNYNKLSTTLSPILITSFKIIFIKSIFSEYKNKTTFIYPFTGYKNINNSLVVKHKAVSTHNHFVCNIY